MNKVFSISSLVDKSQFGLEIFQLKEFFDLISVSEIKNYRFKNFGILISNKGEIGFNIDFKKFFLNKNNVMFFSPGQVISDIVTNDGDCDIILFNESFFNTYYDLDVFKSNFNMLYDLSQRTLFYIEDVYVDKVKSILELLKIDIKRDRTPSTTLVLQHSLSSLIYLFARDRAVKDFKNVFIPEMVVALKFKNLVSKNVSVKYNVEYYLYVMQISKSTLLKSTKLIFEKTPKVIIEEAIVLEAKRLLFISDKRIQEIAYELGFTDPTNFTKFFKKHVGKTPDDFRK